MSYLRSVGVKMLVLVAKYFAALRHLGASARVCLPQSIHVIEPITTIDRVITSTAVD